MELSNKEIKTIATKLILEDDLFVHTCKSNPRNKLS